MLDDVVVEEGELVQEENAVVSAADLARTDPAGAAAEQADPRGGVVWREERALGHQALVALEHSGERQNRGQLQCLIEREVGQDAGHPLGE